MFEFDGEEDAEFEEGPQVFEPEPAPAPAAAAPTVTRLTQDYRNRDIVDLRTDVSANPSLELAQYEKRARAVSLFLKVPFLAYLSLNDRLPAPVRLGAGLLALWEASQLYRGQAEVEETVTEWAR